jgi:hypothetical protein
LLDQKVTKNQVSRKASLPHMAFALQTNQNHGLHLSAPLRFAQPYASAKICYALLALMPVIVLDGFARSWSAAGGIKILYLFYPSQPPLRLGEQFLFFVHLKTLSLEPAYRQAGRERYRAQQ